MTGGTDGDHGQDRHRPGGKQADDLHHHITVDIDADPGHQDIIVTVVGVTTEITVDMMMDTVTEKEVVATGTMKVAMVTIGGKKMVDTGDEDRDQRNQRQSKT